VLHNDFENQIREISICNFEGLHFLHIRWRYILRSSSAAAMKSSDINIRAASYCAIYFANTISEKPPNIRTAKSLFTKNANLIGTFIRLAFHPRFGNSKELPV
jgi:hypothetical protein